MEKIKVQKSDLITVLRENKAKHKEEYEKAVLGYKISVQKALKEKMKELKALPELELGKFGINNISIARPESHLKDFDLAIGMLNLSVDEFVEITESEYREYYLGEFGWKENWIYSNSSNIKAGATAYATLYNTPGVGNVTPKSKK